MKDKNLPHDIQTKSISELTEFANRIIDKLENHKNFEEALDDYQALIRLNNIIEKKFQSSSKNISEITKNKILSIKKNGKKT